MKSSALVVAFVAMMCCGFWYLGGWAAVGLYLISTAIQSGARIRGNV